MANQHQSGFTLLELLIVMVILGVLASYVAPKYFQQIGKSEVKVAKMQMDALSKALDQYRLDTGHYPTTEQGLNALLQSPVGEVRWQGPYLKKEIPNDPWGRPYTYRLPSDKTDLELSSLGRDGKIGGEGDDADLRL